ncbi:hypothetical protein M0R45_019105 [Rubus argutus]|uniref:Uncharacterized protein n=1 Tax=Rubus argutus TaxID=59490 RepID=A0AAW1X7Z2_RUBAR
MAAFTQPRDSIHNPISKPPPQFAGLTTQSNSTTQITLTDAKTTNLKVSPKSKTPHRSPARAHCPAKPCSAHLKSDAAAIDLEPSSSPPKTKPICRLSPSTPIDQPNHCTSDQNKSTTSSCRNTLASTFSCPAFP